MSSTLSPERLKCNAEQEYVKNMLTRPPRSFGYWCGGRSPGLRVDARHLASSPSRVKTQWRLEETNSSTVAGAAPALEMTKLFLTGFPFHPLVG